MQAITKCTCFTCLFTVDFIIWSCEICSALFWFSPFPLSLNPWGGFFSKSMKVRKWTKIRNIYNQVLHLTQDTNGKVTKSQLDITNESQEVSPFPAGDHKATINRHARKHYRNTTEITWMIHKRSTVLKLWWSRKCLVSKILSPENFRN